MSSKHHFLRNDDKNNQPKDNKENTAAAASSAAAVAAKAKKHLRKQKSIAARIVSTQSTEKLKFTPETFARSVKDALKSNNVEHIIAKPKHGIDKKGSYWIPAGGSRAHGGEHWDVVDKAGNHVNVVPGGRIRGKK